MASTAIAAGAEPVFHLEEEHAHAEGGSTMLGFWLYLMSDCLIFAMLFAAFGVLGGNYAAGPAPKDLFDLGLVAVNTTMLLLSSITYGFAMLTMDKGRVGATQAWLAYGKGRHPAALNFADCLSYALAKRADEPLLFIGNDFSQTDIEAA